MKEYIDISKSIFKTKPSQRFAETMGVTPKFWEDMWFRYKFLGYSKKDLQEWFEFKTTRNISIKTVQRWVSRQEIYDDAHFATKRGAKIVNRHFFKRNQELLDNLDDLEDVI